MQIFECILFILATQYQIARRLIYYPGSPFFFFFYPNSLPIFYCDGGGRVVGRALGMGVNVDGFRSNFLSFSPSPKPKSIYSFCCSHFFSVALARDLVFHQNSNFPTFYRGFFLLMWRIESKEL